MPRKIDEQQEPQQVKEEKPQGFKVYADFDFRGKQYKAGDIFTPPADVIPDANMDEFRRVSSKKILAKGRAFYYEIPRKKEEPEIYRVVLPVE